MIKSNKGFSLVDLIVSIALLSIILVAALGLFTNSFKVQGKSSLKTSVTRVAQYITENFKNKNYLGLKLMSGTEEVDLETYIKNKKITDLENDISLGLDLTEEGWELNYNGLKYKADIKLKGINKSNISNLDIPDKSECNGAIKIDSSGEISLDEEYMNTSNTYIDIYSVGSELDSPNDNSNKKYKVNYPTVILGSNYVDIGDDGATIWITNNGYKDVNRQKNIRIIKAFYEPLIVYIDGDMFSIKEGQDGDGASKDYTIIERVFVPEERSSNELIFDAEMTVTDMRDETISDMFTFSFPVNY